MKKKALTTYTALSAYARMINTMNVSHITDLLSDHFQYKSQLVLNDISCKADYLTFINATLKLATQKRLVYDDKWFNPEIRSITHAVRNKLSQRLARYSGPLRFKVILPSRLDTDNWVFDFITKVYISKPPKTDQPSLSNKYARKYSTT